MFPLCWRGGDSGIKVERLEGQGGLAGRSANSFCFLEWSQHRNVSITLLIRGGVLFSFLILGTLSMLSSVK